jgi:hypothetical protein
MNRKEYVTPFLECISLWDSEVGTTIDLLSLSFDNHLGWSDIVKDPRPSSDHRDVIF